MRLLFIGGTRFVGRSMAEAALRRGHEVTLFNRGTTGPDALPGVETLLGDRTTSLDVLKGRTWDAVIDSCGYEPGTVAASAKALEGSVGRYVFISTISAYKPSKDRIKESDAVQEAPEGMPLTGVTGESYGPLKVLCEREVERVYGDRALIVRPGLVVGPGDYTDRFTYWPMRIRAGGDVLVPDIPNAEWQWIDARDLGDFTVHLTEKGASGAYNGVGPAVSTTMFEALDETREALQASVKFVEVSEAFLIEQGVAAWSDLPFVVYPSEGEEGFTVDVEKALSAGLNPRPLAETVLDLMAWKDAQPDASELKTGLTLARQDELLALWAIAQSR